MQDSKHAQPLSKARPDVKSPKANLFNGITVGTWRPGSPAFERFLMWIDCGYFIDVGGPETNKKLVKRDDNIG